MIGRAGFDYDPWDALDNVLATICPPLDDEDYEPEPGDGCLACGRLSCDCDQRYEESREDDR